MSEGTKTGDRHEKQTHFGYRQVPWEEKAERVRGVFDSVADRYDLMNDLMSFGLHRLWKRFAVSQARLKAGQSVLDVAGGTGDLVRLMAPKVGGEGRVVLSDINVSMLALARPRLLDSGVAGNVSFVQADAENLPFPDGSFDCVTIAFGLRNITDKERALQSMAHVLKPGGQLLILEFSHPVSSGLSKLYDMYSFAVLPVLGHVVTRDADSYQYLAESIRMHPGQQELLDMMVRSGLEQCRFNNLSGGIVALHRGYRI